MKHRSPVRRHQSRPLLTSGCWLLLAGIGAATGCGAPIVPMGSQESVGLEPEAPELSPSDAARSRPGADGTAQTQGNPGSRPDRETEWTRPPAPVGPPPTLALAGVEVAHEAGLGIDVAVLRFELKDADFAQILRCSSSFRMRLPNGTRISPAEEQQTRTGDDLGESQSIFSEKGTQVGAGAEDGAPNLEWAWRDALANAESCSLIALRALPGKFEDPSSSAQDEGLYYALNPCTLDPEAPDDLAAARCSYDLAVTTDLNIKRGPAADRKELKEALSRLAQARSDTEGLATSLRAVGASAHDLVSLCERQNSREESLSLLRQGLGHLAGIGIVAATSQAGGLLAIPFVQTKIRSIVQGLFARAPRVPPACQHLSELVDKTKILSERHLEAYQRWTDLSKTIDTLRRVP